MFSLAENRKAFGFKKILKLCSMKKLIYLISTFCGINLTFGFVPYEFKANRITKPPVIDGYLNDPCWKEATRIDKDFRDYIVNDPEYGKIAQKKDDCLCGL
ncbi:MAG: hypothetical protein ABIL70_04820 [candidate division WOR-3 bacterium]